MLMPSDAGLSLALLSVCHTYRYTPMIAWLTVAGFLRLLRCGFFQLFHDACRASLRCSALFFAIAFMASFVAAGYARSKKYFSRRYVIVTIIFDAITFTARRRRYPSCWLFSPRLLLPFSMKI